MIKNMEKTTSMVATSTIGDFNAVQFRANISEDGTVNITKSIKNVEVYSANTEECDADYEKFEAEVIKVAQA